MGVPALKSETISIWKTVLFGKSGDFGLNSDRQNLEPRQGKRLLYSKTSFHFLMPLIAQNMTDDRIREWTLFTGPNQPSALFSRTLPSGARSPCRVQKHPPPRHQPIPPARQSQTSPKTAGQSDFFSIFSTRNSFELPKTPGTFLEPAICAAITSSALFFY